MTQEKKWAIEILLHAEKHYNEVGWDTIVETQGSDDLAKFLVDQREYHKVDTYEQALERVEWLRDLWESQRSEMQATVW